MAFYDSSACLSTEVACFATGDLGWIDPAAGLLHVVGRSDQQVKLRGALRAPNGHGSRPVTHGNCRSGLTALHKSWQVVDQPLAVPAKALAAVRCRRPRGPQRGGGLPGGSPRRGGIRHKGLAGTERCGQSSTLHISGAVQWALRLPVKQCREEAFLTHVGSHQNIFAPADCSRAKRAGPRLCAYVTIASHVRTPPTESSLLQHCRDALPAAAVPLRAVVLPKLPRGPAGKVQRGELPEPRWTSPLTGQHSIVDVQSSMLTLPTVMRMVAAVRPRVQRSPSRHAT